MDTGPTISYDEKVGSNYFFSFKSTDVLVAGEAMKRHLIEKKKEPLSEEDDAKVMQAWRESSDDKIVSRLSGEEVDRRSLKRLHCDGWLNDKIINFSMALLNERNKALYSWKKSLRSYFFDSFFLSALVDNEGLFTYEKVREWTSNINVFNAEKLFFLVHLRNHWMLVVIFMAEKRIQLFDSMEESRRSEEVKQSMDNLLKWLSSESKRLDDLEDRRYRAKHVAGNKLKVQQGFLSADEWEISFTWKESIPQQNNGSDCGVYTIAFADFLADDLALSNICLSTISTYRKKIALYILSRRFPIYELDIISTSDHK